jgi:hypothetical protein
MAQREEKALLVRFAKAAGAGEMLNIHDLKAAYEKAINRPRPCWAPIGIRPKGASRIHLFVWRGLSERWHVHQPSLRRRRASRQYLAALPAALRARAQPEVKSVGRDPRENLQKLCPQIRRRRARQTQGGDPLHGTQARNCKIHHLIPLHSQVTLMWKWYEMAVQLCLMRQLWQARA